MKECDERRKNIVWSCTYIFCIN